MKGDGMSTFYLRYLQFLQNRGSNHATGRAVDDDDDNDSDTNEDWLAFEFPTFHQSVPTDLAELRPTQLWQVVRSWWFFEYGMVLLGRTQLWNSAEGGSPGLMHRLGPEVQTFVDKVSLALTL